MVRTVSRREDGFTLVELLVVIAIMMILMGLLMPALSAARYSAHKGTARSEVKQIETAWKAYYDDYRKLPGGISAMDKPACQILRGGNDRQVYYMEFEDKEITGGFLDPWEHPYRVALDTSGNNQVTAGAHGQLSRSVAVWSVGRDGVDGTEDDIKSWK